MTDEEKGEREKEYVKNKGHENNTSLCKQAGIHTYPNNGT
jgi:hypothetical protein